jgi:branched-chain amino acid transport system permease protein
MGVATVVGAFSTRSAGTIFAMISLGVVELVASFSSIIVAFFGYGGAIGDRTFGLPVFGIDFARQIEVYYLVAGWLVASTALMYGFTRTPLGRMANAVRDNPERAEFVGYSARWVRFFSFCGAGFFAGVAGGLSAISFEIATAENLTVNASGVILLVAFLGGVGVFFGPILGAIVFTLLQTVLSFETELWQLYVGALFVATVMYFPQGLAGILLAHMAVARRGNLRRLTGPYLATLLPAFAAILGVASLFEMLHHQQNAGLGQSEMMLFWVRFDSANMAPWSGAALVALAGVWLARRNAAGLRLVWEDARRA